MAQLENDYSAEATQGPLICDIKYPMDAPGFVYDPTGSIQKDAFKNGKQVILLLMLSNAYVWSVKACLLLLFAFQVPLIGEKISSNETCLGHTLVDRLSQSTIFNAPYTYLNCISSHLHTYVHPRFFPREIDLSNSNETCRPAASAQCCVLKVAIVFRTTWATGRQY